MSIRGFLRFSLSGLGLTILVLAGYGAYDAWTDRRDAMAFLAAERVVEFFLDAESNLSLERGLCNAPLHDSEPLAENRRGEVAAQRTAADEALRQALDGITRIPGMADSVAALDALKKDFAEFARFRRRVDESLAKPRTERADEVVDTFAPRITALISRITELRRMLDILVTIPHVDVARYVGLRAMAAEMAERAGRERFVFGGNVAQRTPFSVPDIQAAAQDRGRVELTWTRINAFRARTDLPAGLSAAISKAEAEYMGRLGELRMAVLAASGTGQYPVSGREWVDRSGAALATVIAVAKEAGLVAKSAADAAMARANRRFAGHFALLVVSLIAATVSLTAARSIELRRTNMWFDAALNNMSQGLCLLDADQRVVVSNKFHREIYGLSPDQVKSGTTLRQLIAHCVANGTYCGPDPDEYVQVNFRRSSDIETLSDGRVISLSRHPMQDGGCLVTFEDVTDRQRNEARVTFMAHHDLLTGLANRSLFMEKVQDACTRQRRSGGAFAVFMLDLDRFKNVNDSLGHPTGDALLKEMAQRLKSSLRETDVVARLGGDEFAILQSGGAALREDAIMLAGRILDVVGRPFDIDGHSVGVGASLGITLAPQDGIAPDDLLKKADLALYRTKSEGRNGYSFFHADMTAEADSRHRMENEMRAALARNEFELHYQPIFDAQTREPRGAEALVRWRHPERGLIAPDQFISLAEATGLIIPLGNWVLRKACAEAVLWPEHIKLAVNLSSVQFRKGILLDVILSALADSGLPPERLELEITESVLLKNEADYRDLLRQLKNTGIAIVLDDFGTGYSSLGHLTSFPVDKIKIDKSFTQGLSKRTDCAVVVASVLTLAHGLDIVTTAEGVETEEQLDLLRLAGVNLMQGYLLGRPVPASDLTFIRGRSDARVPEVA